MKNPRFNYLGLFYVVVGLLFFFTGMNHVQFAHWRYAEHTAEWRDIVDWMPVLATISFSVGWGSGYLTAFGKTPQARVQLYVVGAGIWILWIAVVVAGFGFDSSQPLRSPGVGVGVGLTQFILGGYFLNAPKQTDRT